MPYKVEITKRAFKEMGKLPAKVRESLFRLIIALENTPRPSDAKKLSNTEDVFRLHEGEYRIIYRIDDGKLLVMVLRGAHRKDVYRRLEELL